MLGRGDHAREELADAPMNDGGVLRGDNVVTWVPDQTVTRLRTGDRIGLTAGDIERPSARPSSSSSGSPFSRRAFHAAARCLRSPCPA